MFECGGGGRCRGVGKVSRAELEAGGNITDSLMRPPAVVNSNFEDSVLRSHI